MEGAALTTAVIYGGARCLEADLRALPLLSHYLRVGINDALYTLRDLDCVATLHPENVRGGGPDKEWLRKRRENGWADVPVWTHNAAWADQEGFRVWRSGDAAEDTIWTRGSSGLFAVGVALHALKADRVILCGVPMDHSPNRYRDEDEWKQWQRYRIGWTQARDRGMLENVRSVSGWTADLLGRPEWTKAA